MLRLCKRNLNKEVLIFKQLCTFVVKSSGEKWEFIGHYSSSCLFCVSVLCGGMLNRLLLERRMSECLYMVVGGDAEIAEKGNFNRIYMLILIPITCHQVLLEAAL